MGEILDAHQANKERLAHLHLQVAHEFENAVPRRASSEQFRVLAPMSSSSMAKTINSAGRSPKRTGVRFRKFRFAAGPLTAERLMSDFRHMALFSYSAAASPPLTIWSGNGETFAAVSQKHLGDTTNVDLPPLVEVVSPPGCGSANRHPIDSFFLEPAERYRVVGQELIDGRMLTIVELIVPVEGQRYLEVYRAWLDLAQGALPIKIERRQTLKERLPILDRWQPYEITTTRRIVALPGGGFYPATTRLERWDDDPRANLSEADWDDVRAGRRRPAQVIVQTYDWDCPLIEIKTDFAKDFFVIPFPPGQKIYDYDADPEADRKPQVEVGQQAPPLTISRWLDGKPRTLDDLKGQVVVLNFWALWCSGCRAEVPQLQALEKQFQGQPVTFISIHQTRKTTWMI